MTDCVVVLTPSKSHQSMPRSMFLHIPLWSWICIFGFNHDKCYRAVIYATMKCVSEYQIFHKQKGEGTYIFLNFEI
jgi:hypothetical protein